MPSAESADSMTPPPYPSHFDPNDPRMHDFFRRLIHSAIDMAMRSLMWKLPVFWLILVLGGLIGAVVWFGWY